MADSESRLRVYHPSMPFPAGTILGFSGEALVSRAIREGERIYQGSDYSYLSHIAIATEIGPSDLWRPERTVRTWKPTKELPGRDLYVVESTTEDVGPCLVLGRHVEGVKVRPFWDRVNRYDGDVYAICPADPLSYDAAQVLTDQLLDVVGTPYDVGGAILSGTKWLKWLNFFKTSDRSSVFCSETATAALKFAHQYAGSTFPDIEPGAVTPAELADALIRPKLYRPPVLIHKHAQSAA